MPSSNTPKIPLVEKVEQKWKRSPLFWAKSGKVEEKFHFCSTFVPLVPKVEFLGFLKVPFWAIFDWREDDILLKDGPEKPNQNSQKLSCFVLESWSECVNARVFLFAEPLKSLENKGNQKARKIGKRKKQGNRKKQGLEGQGPYRRYGPDTEFQYRPLKPRGLAKPRRILFKREADTEFQYRPHIVDTDIDCGRHFCGRHFRDSYVGRSWKPEQNL